jgi:hypothetical protein
LYRNKGWFANKTLKFGLKLPPNKDQSASPPFDPVIIKLNAHPFAKPAKPPAAVSALLKISGCHNDFLFIVTWHFKGILVNS